VHHWTRDYLKELKNATGVYEAFPFPGDIVSSDVYFLVCETGVVSFSKIGKRGQRAKHKNFSKKVNEIQA